ncbi:hypothetical protein [Cellulosilyticum sp. WCF-2]|uniref:hypothetical protein n=1 Tax=Cellulosilyticum sp. WCF-2 TaxID=2497860 RepID=UPI000F8DA303|nr:hypothetical protein [Cellulosilyticum sp. WCF-2]QEH67324.1 hypothetical protein EKH84_02290 [Cellulosilyticum sp. WCF-2]
MDDYNEPEDLPLGLMMQLGTNMNAMNTFANLSISEKEEIINYIKGDGMEDDVKERIEKVMNALENNQSLF